MRRGLGMASCPIFPPSEPVRRSLAFDVDGLIVPVTILKH